MDRIEQQIKNHGIQITNITNPFDPLHNREFKIVPAGLSLKECIDMVRSPMDGCFYVASINGELVPEDADYALTYPTGNLVLCAEPLGGGGQGGKNSLRMVLQMVVVVVAAAATWYLGGAGGYLVGAGWGLGAANAAAVGVGLAISVVGNLLISALLPYDQLEQKDQSRTYSWDANGGNVNREGIVWPVLYGTCRITPPIIAKYIEIQDDKQYYNILYAIADHQVTSIDETSVRINDNPVSKDEDNIWWETRLGTTSQGIMQYFNDTISTKSISTRVTTYTDYSDETAYNVGDQVTYNKYAWECIQAHSAGARTPKEGAYWTKITHPWVTVDADGTQTEGLGIVLSLPYGLYKAKDDGSTSEYTVELDIEYKEANEETWSHILKKNTKTETILADRWSGGYWWNGIWYEVGAGSTDPAAHNEHDRYEFVSYNIYGEGDFGQVYEWHWVTDADTIYVEDTLELDYVQITEKKTSSIRRRYPIHNVTPGSYQVRVRFHDQSPSTSSKVAAQVYFDYVESIIYDDFEYPGTALFALRALATDKFSGGIPTLSLVATRSTVPVWTGSAYANKPADNPAWAAYDVLHNTQYGGGVPYTKLIYADFLAWANNCDTHYTAEGVPSTVSFKCNYYIDESITLRKVLNNIGQLGRGMVVQMGSEYSCYVDKLETTPAQSFIFNTGNVNAKSLSVEYMPMEDRANAIDITFWDKTNFYKQRTIELHAADFDTTTIEVKKTQLQLKGCTSIEEAMAHGYFALNCNRLLTCTASFKTDIDSIGCLPWDVVELQHDVTNWGEGGLVVAAVDTNTITIDKSITLTAGTTYTLRIQDNDDDSIASYTLSVPSTVTTNTLNITTTFSPAPALHDKWVVTATGKSSKLFRLIKTTRVNDLTRRLTCLEYNATIYDDTRVITLEDDPTAPIYESHLRACEMYNYNGLCGTYVHLSWQGRGMTFYVFYKAPGATSYTYVGQTNKNWYNIPNLPVLSSAYTFCVSHTRNPMDGTTVTYTVTGKPPNAFGNVPTNLTATVFNDHVVLKWTANTDKTTVGYNLYCNDVLIDMVGLVTTYDYYGDPGTGLTAGEYAFEISSVDAYGSESTSYETTLTINIPSTPAPTATIVDRNIVVTWADCKTDFTINFYTVNDLKVGNTHSWSERITGTGVKTYTVKAYDVFGNASAPGSASVTVHELTQPSDIDTVGLIYSCKVTVTYATFDGFEAVEIWSSATNDRDTAVMVAELYDGDTWTHTGLDLVDTRYYWARCRNYLGEYGLWYPEGATSGVAGSSSSDPTDYLTVLNGSLTESQLYNKLIERINLIDTAAAAWASGTAYAVGDIILKDDVYYRCKVAHTNHVPPNATYWDVISDGLINEWTVKLTAAGKVAGVGMMMDPTSGASEFIILSNKFQVVDPSDTLDPKPIFTVGPITVDGVTHDAVGIDGDLIINGSLAVNRLTSGTIHAAQITLGNIGAPGYDNTYIASGKTEFSTTNAGFILGLDHAVGNVAKFYIGDTSNYMYWDGTKLVCNMLGDFKTSATYPRVEFDASANKMKFIDSNGNTAIVIGANSNTYTSYLYALNQQAKTSDCAMIEAINVGTMATGTSTDKANIAVKGTTNTTKASGTRSLMNIGIYGSASGGDSNNAGYFNADVYATGNVSALSFTDRTPHYEGDALSEIKKIAGKNGMIDHSTLPTFARMQKKVPKNKNLKDNPESLEIVTEEHRDIGAMVSILTVAIQQLTDRIEKLETKS